MKKTILLLVTLLVVSCSDYSSVLDKTVLEPLSIEDLKSIEKDSTFSHIYELSEEFRERIKNRSNLEKLEFEAVTYKRVYDYVVYLEQDRKLIDFFNSELPKWEKKGFNSEFDYDFHLSDSIMKTTDSLVYKFMTY